jgi:hypothetical protein
MKTFKQFLLKVTEKTQAGTLSDNVGKIVPLRRMKQYCCVGVNRTATSE